MKNTTTIFKKNQVKTTNATYNFSNISQMLDVLNDDNIEVLVEDFAKFLILYNNSIKKVKELHPNETNGKTNLEILNAEFVWTDDGVSELTSYTITNTKSGLVKKVEINKK